MRNVVVYGARQCFGFEMCKQLLEKGYFVHAVDHEQWQTEQNEEQWMFVGRNANLIYDELVGNEQRLCNDIEKHPIYMIPLIDYCVKQHSDVQEQLVTQLQLLSTRAQTESLFIFVHPLAVQREQETFVKESGQLIQSIRKKEVPLIEYFVPTFSHKGGNIFMREAEREQWKKIDEQCVTHDATVSRFVKEMIIHLEKEQVFCDRT